MYLQGPLKKIKIGSWEGSKESSKEEEGNRKE